MSLGCWPRHDNGARAARPYRRVGRAPLRVKRGSRFSSRCRFSVFVFFVLPARTPSKPRMMTRDDSSGEGLANERPTQAITASEH
jgi:hypothetical protein